MNRRLLSLGLSLLLTALVALSAMGRTSVRCVDGSPCTPESVATARPCCQPDPCHEPARKQCVVEHSPGTLRIAPEAGLVVFAPALVAIVPLRVVLTPLAPLVERHEEKARPPDCLLFLKLGYAPRPPPDHV